jgi:hypothetical protein
MAEEGAAAASQHPASTPSATAAAVGAAAPMTTDREAELDAWREKKRRRLEKEEKTKAARLASRQSSIITSMAGLYKFANSVDP